MRNILFLSLLGLLACSKSEDPYVPPQQNPRPGGDSLTPGSLGQRLLDSLFLYARQVYLWNTELPGYEEFNPRQFYDSGDELANLNEALFSISRYAVNPETGRSYEYWEEYPEEAKYSFATEAGSSGTVTLIPGGRSDMLEGEGDDMGFALTAVAIDDIRVRYVIPGSPAHEANLARGYRLVELNGRAVTVNDEQYIISALNANSLNASFETPENEIVEAVLRRESYTFNPVYKAEVFSEGGKKIGYLAYASFTRRTHSQPELEAAFDQFAEEGVQDLIIDLRYNGGGYVATAEYLSNLLAPSSADRQVMTVEHFNQTMQEGQANLLRRQPLPEGPGTYADVDYSIEANTYRFDKEGSLSPERVVFIVTASTASASELVINSLRPYMDVKLVGETSYGKPVGFFPIRIGGYDVYYSMFQSKNAEGEGDYFSGMEPDAASVDDVTRDFGDAAELSTAKAISYLTEGTFTVTDAMMTLRGSRKVSERAVETRNIGEDPFFKGMIEDRVRTAE